MLTTPGKNYVAEVVFGQNDAVLGSYYVGLLLSTPNADGVTYSEPSGGAYARVAVTNSVANFSTASSGVVSNLTVVTFPTATAAWGSISFIGLFDALSAGNLLAYGGMNPNKYVGSGYEVNIPVGNLTITMRATVDS